jgi:hypothetical protein
LTSELTFILLPVQPIVLNLNLCITLMHHILQEGIMETVVTLDFTQFDRQLLGFSLLLCCTNTLKKGT